MTVVRHDVPQPWQVDGISEAEHIERARKLEAKTGCRLVIQTLINGYAPFDDDEAGWVADALRYDDWRTGEHIVTLTEDDDSVCQGFAVVRRQVVGYQ